MKFHRTKDGKKIKMADLELGHLMNILKWIERRAMNGVDVRLGGGSTAQDMWYEHIWHGEDTYFGEEAKEYLNFYDYKSELEKREGKIINEISK